MAKKSNISFLNPIVRKHVREEEEKIGRKLNRQERHEFIKNDKKQIKRNFRRNFIKGSFIAGLAALGITIGARALPEPKNNTPNTIEQSENKSKAEQFKKSVQYEVEPINLEEKQNEENISKEIIEKYNSEYNQDLAEEDIGYIKSSPRFLTIDKEGKYSFDSTEKNEFEEVISEDELGNTYVVVNKQENEIISAVGEVKSDVVNVDVKQIKVGQTEYTNSNKTIDLTIDEEGNKKTKEENEDIYNKVKSAYKQRVEEQER